MRNDDIITAVGVKQDSFTSGKSKLSGQVQELKYPSNFKTMHVDLT